jgi:hypothetical protein
MTSASLFLTLLLPLTVAAPCYADPITQTSVPPVARLQMANGLDNQSQPRPVPRIWLPEPGSRMTGIIFKGIEFLTSDRVSTQAGFHDGSASGPRLDLSIGFNF